MYSCIIKRHRVRFLQPVNYDQALVFGDVWRQPQHTIPAEYKPAAKLGVNREVPGGGYGCSYMFHLSGNARCNSHFTGS